MNRIKQSWNKWSERIDAMALRERVIVFFAVALALLFLFIKLVSNPVTDRQREVARQLAQKQVDMRLVQDETQKMLGNSRNDPDHERRERVDALKKRIAELDSRLVEKQRELVPPERVTGMLEEILRRDRKLELLQLQSIPPKPLFEAPAAEPDGTRVEPVLQVYRHGVELTVRGTYFDLLNYLNDLEKLPLRMFWGEVEISTEEYPVISMKLSVYTLSLERSWVVMKRAFACAVLLCAAANAAAQGQTLSDPMRPPAGANTSATATKGPVLQTISIGPDHRYAIISGERVVQGGRYGDAKVLRISANEVTLRDDMGETVLKLYPDVHKIILSPTSPGVTQGAKGKQK